MDFGKVNNVWQLLGGPVLAPVTLTVLLLLWFTQPDIVFYQWLLALHFPLFLFHEFEEYVLPGGFGHPAVLHPLRAARRMRSSRLRAIGGRCAPPWP